MNKLPFQDSALTAEVRTADLLSRLTIAEKINLLSGHQEAIPRLGVPEFYVGTEVARGFVSRDPARPSTVFPQPIGLAATFDPSLMHTLGEIAATEARAYYNADHTSGLMLWGPTVDMERDPRWGRTEEAYGEEPFLTGEMTVAYTLGMRGDNPDCCRAIPTLKHFCANNEEQHRCDGSSNLSPRLRHEYYYAAFRPAITRGGAQSVMTAYNAINGCPAVLNDDLNSVLKNDWGLSFIVTDGGDFIENVTRHHTHTSHAQSLADCLHAGIDSFTDDGDTVHRAAETALAQGKITEAELDRAVGNVLAARFRLGLFDATPFDKIGSADICTPAAAQVNLRAALAGIILLKNDGILPLCAQKTPSIAVLGATAAECFRDWYTGIFPSCVTPADGIRAAFPDAEITCDTCHDHVLLRTAEGYLRVRADGFVCADAATAAEATTFEQHSWGEGFVNFLALPQRRYLRLGDSGNLCLHNSFIYDWFPREALFLTPTAQGVVFTEYLHGQPLGICPDGRLGVQSGIRRADATPFTIEIQSRGAERAAALAAAAGVVVCCVGNDPIQSAKECHDRTTLDLPAAQLAVLEAARRANPNTVLAVISSYPYNLCAAQETLPAILHTSHAGPMLGIALGQVLSGQYNPAGRTPLTWYRSEAELPDIGDYDVATNRVTSRYFDGEPLYPFGFGLSYASFVYDALTVSVTPDAVLLRCTVQNTAACDGEEVVQAYYTPDAPSVPRPLRQLCAFARVAVPAGSTVSVSLTVPREELAFYDVARDRFCVESGSYTFAVGGSSRNLPLRQSVFISGETVSPRSLAAPVPAIRYDAQNALTERYSMTLRRGYLFCAGWSGSVTYRQVQLAGCTRLLLSVCSVGGTRSLSVQCDGKEIAVCPIPPGDGYESFHTVAAALPPDCTVHTLTLCFSENVALLELQAE